MNNTDTATIVRTITIEEGTTHRVVRVFQRGDDRAIVSMEDDGEGSWYRKVVMTLPSEIVLGAQPSAPCERPYGCTSRRPCDPCYAQREWQDTAIGIGAEMAGWEGGLWQSYGGPGRPFRDTPWARIKGGRLIVSQRGGLDI